MSQSQELLFRLCVDGSPVENIDKLLKEGTDANYCCDEGTPLTYAIKTVHVELSMCLMAHSSTDFNLKDTGGYAPLIIACMCDQNEPQKIMIAKLLIVSQGVDLNVRDPAGNTPLMFCCLMGNIELVMALLLKSADTNLKNDLGMTALHNAASINSPEIVSALINHGAKSYPDKSGKFPKNHTEDPEVIKILEAKKTSISHPFEVDFINNKMCPVLKNARIGMSMCPGRLWSEWCRDFDSDLRVIVENEVDVVASIITHTELAKMEHPDFFSKIRQYGLESIDFSVHDKWLPNSIDNFLKMVKIIVGYLRQEKKVLIHCNGGRGRTGLVAAACLIVFGYKTDAAIEIVRTARTRMLRNPTQTGFLFLIEGKLQTMFNDVKEQVFIKAANSSPPSPTLGATKKNKLLSMIHRAKSLEKNLASSEGSPEGSPISWKLFSSRSENSSPRPKSKSQINQKKQDGRSRVSSTTQSPKQVKILMPSFHTIDVIPTHSEEDSVYSAMERGDPVFDNMSNHKMDD